MAKGESRGNKRKFGSGRGSSHYGPTPRRGPPALFVTCESGREKKCQREALELIHHYYYGSKHTTADTESKETSKDREPSPLTTKEEDISDDKPLSLQDELAMLRKGAVAEEVLNSKRPRHGYTNGIATSKQVSTMKSPFSIYDSGMRGMVCILCTLPNCEMVPYDQILAELKATKEKDNTTTNNSNSDDKSSIKIATEASKETKVNEVQWDPVDTVRCILRDAKIINKKSDEKDDNSKQKGIGQAEDDQKKAAALLTSSPPPGSRYISRILPMQATVSECIFSQHYMYAISMN